MENKMIGLILTLAVGVIMTGALLAPVVASYGDQTMTYVNDGVPYAEIDDDTHVIVVSYDGSEYSMTTDGEAVEMPDLSLYGAATIVYGSDGIVRLGSDGSVRAFTTTIGGYNVDEDTPVTITLDSSGVVITDGETPLTYSFNTGYYVATSGDYVLCLNPCVTDDTIVMAGTTSYNSNAEVIAWYGTGTVDSIAASVIYASLTDSKTVSSVSATADVTAITSELMKINGIEFTAVLSDSSEYEATFSYFLAPATVTYDNPNYLGASVAGILTVVVVVTIIALIALTTKGFGNRDE